MEAAMTTDTPTSPPPSASGYVHDDTPVALTDTAISVLATLPTNVKPILLSIDFPHIVNKIADLWLRPILLDRYFEELTIDARGGRRGFPLAIANEIADLREHYQTRVRPIKKTTWDMSI
jgi:hypothetical protein